MESVSLFGKFWRQAMATEDEIIFESETEKKDIKSIRKKFEGQMYLDPTVVYALVKLENLKPNFQRFRNA